MKKTFVPLEPQPQENEIMILKRYYATLQREKKYKKKRISWFEHIPGMNSESYKTVSVAEYLGTFPGEEISKHGNSRKNNQEYIRTSPKTKENVMAAIKSKKTGEGNL